jgi:hypothetical protein
MSNRLGVEGRLDMMGGYGRVRIGLPLHNGLRSAATLKPHAVRQPGSWLWGRLAVQDVHYVLRPGVQGLAEGATPQGLVGRRAHLRVSILQAKSHTAMVCITAAAMSTGCQSARRIRTMNTGLKSNAVNCHRAPDWHARAYCSSLFLVPRASALSRLKHGFQTVTSNQNVSDLFACRWLLALATNERAAR